MHIHINPRWRKSPLLSDNILHEPSTISDVTESPTLAGWGRKKLSEIYPLKKWQIFQLSRILRETHAFDIFLTLTRINTIFSRKSEKIGSDPTFVLTLLFASKYSYLAESIAIK
jgi:hypothetical protein